MLDVHPPSHAANTWRDFFIHIATIVVGLLIAVGLEQSVEWLHRHHEVAETREALAQEHEVNRKNFALDTRALRVTTALLENNLAVLEYLQQHPAAEETTLPGVLLWASGAEGSFDAAWRTAQQATVLSYMPREEVSAAANLYNRLAILRADGREVWTALNEARRYSMRDANPAHLSREDLAEEITLTGQVLVKLYIMGSDMLNLSADFPDFACAFTAGDLQTIFHTHTPDQQKLLAGPLAATRARIAAAAAGKE